MVTPSEASGGTTIASAPRTMSTVPSMTNSSQCSRIERPMAASAGVG